MQMSIPDGTRPREHDGWRSGRPVEDPAKTKRWGFVTAKPSEFLVHCRRGRVLESSGQGASCFKWPWDSVSIVPTSLQRLHFRADQITRERVGVAVTALAVYRVSDPLLAYRVLNFSYPERAQERLEYTLTQMLVGATRRLVANLSVDACLQERKSALAEELLREIAPVVGGQGRLDDRSDRGWGVVLDTVEIQEVQILSNTVFADMQAPFRAALQRRAREAQIEHEAAVAEREAELRRAALERSNADRIRELELALREEEARVADVLRRQQLVVEEAEGEIAGHEIRARAQALRQQLEDGAHQAELARRSTAAELQGTIELREAQIALAAGQAEREHAAARAQIITAEKLPELAGAVGQRIGEVKITQIGSGGDNPFASVAQAVAAVVELASPRRSP